MFKEEYELVAGAAKNKILFLKKNPWGYLLLSVLAGMYIGFGTLLIFTGGGLLAGAPYTRIVMGLSFGIALSLVVLAGAELFTGNNFIMAAGLFTKKVSLADVVKLWLVCYIGNWLGGLLLAALYSLTQLQTPEIAEFISKSAVAKASIPFMALFARAILCNMLVCLAVWSGFKLKSESGKLIMIFWCLFAFITSGFEHSIANMTLLSVVIMQPGQLALSVWGYFYNIVVVTLGNMVGGIVFLALPYLAATLKKED